MRRHFHVAFIGAVVALCLPAGVPAAEELAAASVGDTAAVPDNAGAIGRVHPGSGRYCTGTLVARKTVVTAAHCLVDPRSKRWIRAESLHFLGGYRIGQYDYHARVASYTASPAYNPKEPQRSLAADWAMLTLTDTSDEGAPIRSRRGEAGNMVGEVTGYAMQKKYALSTSEPCKMQKIGFLLFGECKALLGMSGAPLIDVATGEILGIQVAAGNREGRDFMVAVPASNWRKALEGAR